MKTAIATLADFVAGAPLPGCPVLLHGKVVDVADTTASHTLQTDRVNPHFAVLLQKADEISVFALRADPGATTITLGRGSKCGVRLPFTDISKEHAEVRVSADFAIHDLDSRNGTFLQGARLSAGESQPLRDYGIISLGQRHFLFMVEATLARLVAQRRALKR